MLGLLWRKLLISLKLRSNTLSNTAKLPKKPELGKCLFCRDITNDSVGQVRVGFPTKILSDNEVLVNVPSLQAEVIARWDGKNFIIKL